MTDGIALLLIVVIPFMGGLVAGFLPTNARNAEAWLAGGVALSGLLLSLWLYPTLADGGVVRFTAQWMPSLGLDFSLRLDGFAWLFCLLICGIGTLVVIYARYYMSPQDPVPRFFSFLLAFMGAMLGIVLSGNLIQLAFFWELTSLFSFLLIGYWHHNQIARDGARMALTITAAGGLCLLAGLLLIGHIVGSYDLDVVLASGNQIREHDLYLPALVLVLLGALTKSAQFPFQFWLPNAMVAPTPVSAFLHSATMVKAGVFLLARFWPVLSGTDAWLWMVGGAGLVTLLLGAYAAMFQQDLKGLLAYSTISHLGLITLLLGMNSPLAAVAAVFHIMNHATFKASLFMAAGVIDHESGTRDIRRLSGLARIMPITATLAMVAAAAMAGVPLLNGFLSKEMFFAETLHVHRDSLLHAVLPFVATLAGMFSVAYSLRFIVDVFFGPPPVDIPRTPHEPPRWMRFPIEALVLACLVVGVIPALAVGPALGLAVEAILGERTPTYSLALWHGFNMPLLMSVIALVGGVVLYMQLRRYLASNAAGPPLTRALHGHQIFERIILTVFWTWARGLLNVIGTLRLQPQLGLMVLLAITAAAWPFLRGGLALPAPDPASFDVAFALVWVVGAACAVATAWMAKFHRLAALMLMGGTGLIVCLSFVWLSAPDLAMTQLLVEVVTTVLLLLGLRWLPKRLESVPNADPMLLVQWRHLRDMTLAVGSGLGIAYIAYAVMTRPQVDSIAHNFLERAYTEGGGTNVVNVILVDFRGFDTLGEITVLGIVALTVFALLRRFRPAPESVPKPNQQLRQTADDEQHPEREVGDTLAEYMLVPRLIMHWLFPVVGAFAIYLLLRGHDLPGGGFAAGVALSIAFVMQYMAGGTRWMERRMVLPAQWIGYGLLLATLTGIGAWLFGQPFLTSYFRYFELPLIGAVPVASALLFDIGVFLLVVGATGLVLIALAHQSIRSQRAARPTESPITHEETEG